MSTASTTGTADDLKDHLLGIERGFWNAEPAYHAANCTDDALTVLPGEVLELDEGLPTLEEVPPLQSLVTEDVRLTRLTDDAAVLVFRVTAEREGRDGAFEAHAASVYVRRDGRWQLAHHQHTPLPDD